MWTRLSSSFLFATVLMLWMAVPLLAAESNTPQELLKKNGIDPSAKGVIAYLKKIETTRERLEAVEKLIEQLGASKFKERKAAARDLAKMGLIAVDPLQRAGKSNDPELRFQSHKLLLGFDHTEDKELLYAAVKMVEQLKPAGSVPVLIGVVPLCKDTYLAYAVQETLKNVAKASDRRTLEMAVKAKNPVVRHVAIRTLSGTLPDGEVKSLYPLFKDTDDEVRLIAAVAVLNREDRTALTVLGILLLDGTPDVRGRAVNVLRQVSGKYLEYHALKDPRENGVAVKSWSKWIENEGMEGDLKLPVSSFGEGIGYLNGNTLYAYGGGKKVEEVDPNGKVVFSFTCQHPWNAEKMREGNYLITDHSGSKILIVNRKGEIVWEYACRSPLHAKALMNGNILIAEYSGKRALEVNRKKEIVWQYNSGSNVGDVQRLPNGNTLVSAGDRVIEVAPNGNVAWEWKGGVTIYSSQRLTNGNTLIGLNSRGKVIEIDRAKNIVWEYPFDRVCDAYRMPNGNTLITGRSASVEVTRDKKVLTTKTGFNRGSARK